LSGSNKEIEEIEEIYCLHFGYIFGSQVDGWNGEELVGVISLLLGLGCSEYLCVVVSYCRL